MVGPLNLTSAARNDKANENHKTGGGGFGGIYVFIFIFYC